MAKMTDEQIAKHKENPNILVNIKGKNFRCNCGCNVFHHTDDDCIYICNACNTEYEAR